MNWIELTFQNWPAVFIVLSMLHSALSVVYYLIKFLKGDYSGG